MPKDARNKLRSMGGIMASSPELMQAAMQGYQAGGPVMTGPQLPQPDSVTVPGVGAPVVGLGRIDPMRPARPVPDKVPQVGKSYRDMVYEATVPSQADLDARFQASQKRTEVFPETESRFTALPPEYLVAPLVGEQMGLPERTPSPHPEYTGPVANETDRAIADFLGEYVIDPSFSAAESIGRLIEDAAPSRPSPAQEPEPGTTQAPPLAVYDNPVFMENLLPPGAEEPTRAEKIKTQATEALSKDAASTTPSSDSGAGDEGGPTGGTGTGGPRRTAQPTKRDLRSRYKEKIELFKEIYGEDDEDRARDKAMSLAMLGLAIAAGQSPDALTNIAQGAMAGLQGMSEQEKARREREQAVQTLALESAMGDIESEASAEEKRLDREATIRAAEIRSAGANRYGTATNPISAAIRLLQSKQTAAGDMTTPLGRRVRGASPEDRRRILLEEVQKDLMPIYGPDTPSLVDLENIDTGAIAGTGTSEEDAAKALGL